MTMDYSGLLEALGPQAAAAEGFLPDKILFDELTIYIHFPGLDQVIPDAKPWVRMDLGEVSAQQGLDPDLLGQFGQSDPTQLLAWLQATGTSVWDFFMKVGFIRYSFIIVHVVVMAAMLMKMALRWTINLKYIVYIPEHFINI